MAAFTPIPKGYPPNSADIAARKTLAVHTGTGTKSTPSRVSPGSARTKTAQSTGSRVSGGGSITGGKG